MLPDFLNPIYYSPDKYSYFKYHFDGLDVIETNYSQLHQDLFVLSFLNGCRGGFYLEIGASYPMHLSNTYLLETRFDWQGIAIELDQEKASKHRILRTNKCLNIDALTVSYASLLQSIYAPQIIDYLSIDIDPPQFSLKALELVLKATDYKFRIITFEHDLSNGGNNERIQSRKLLSELGYHLAVPNVSWGQFCIEDWWVNPELINIDQLTKMSAHRSQDLPTDIHDYFYTRYTLN